MTTLVTGGAGYIGSHAVLELIAADEKVVVLDNLSTGFGWAVPPIAKLIVGDFGDNNLVTEIIRDQGIDSIIHLAARTIVWESIVDPLRRKKRQLLRRPVLQRLHPQICCTAFFDSVDNALGVRRKYRVASPCAFIRHK